MKTSTHPIVYYIPCSLLIPCPYPVLCLRVIDASAHRSAARSPDPPRMNLRTREGMKPLDSRVLTVRCFEAFKQFVFTI
ncbi:hypothetical protein JB92DRAFT_2889728 [Gautieria morchelliformis]|nr:hypothetical protein JB92DRAFT_2889728 [Gautieria morchelliformis]